jgi:hypothetical protein
MKLTELKIAPKRGWEGVSTSNPLVCTVKLSSETATVETTLHEDQVRQVLALVQSIVAEAAQRNVAAFVSQVNVAAFVSQVTAIEAQKEIEA